MQSSTPESIPCVAPTHDFPLRMDPLSGEIPSIPIQMSFDVEDGEEIWRWWVWRQLPRGEALAEVAVDLAVGERLEAGKQMRVDNFFTVDLDLHYSIISRRLAVTGKQQK
jgi:hypothetical protein